MIIRNERPEDIEKIWSINVEAFGGESEANLVDSVRESGIPYISLVYEENHELVGHILFSQVELMGDTSGLRIMGLGPMAVVPELQNKGIGSSLVKAGIQRCIDDGYDAIVVLGHPDYYPRFGFIPSIRYNIQSEYVVPDDVFMLLELRENSLKGKHGKIKYHDAFESTL